MWTDLSTELWINPSISVDNLWITPFSGQDQGWINKLSTGGCGYCGQRVDNPVETGDNLWISPVDTTPSDGPTICPLLRYPQGGWYRGAASQNRPYTPLEGDFRYHGGYGGYPRGYAPDTPRGIGVGLYPQGCGQPVDKGRSPLVSHPLPLVPTCVTAPATCFCQSPCHKVLSRPVPHGSGTLPDTSSCHPPCHILLSPSLTVLPPCIPLGVSGGRAVGVPLPRARPRARSI